MRYSISYTCEVGPGKCSGTAVYAYPAMWPRQWMALCINHAVPHKDYVLPIDCIQRGQRLPLWDARPSDVPRGPALHR